MAALLLVAHVSTDIHFYGLSANTLWGADLSLDKCLWIAVFLLVISALLPKKTAIQN